MTEGALRQRQRGVLVAGEFLLLAVILTGAAWFAGQSRLDGDLPLRVLLAVSLLQISFYYCDLYDDTALRSRTQMFVRMGRGFAAATLGLGLIYYLFPQLGFNRATLLVFLPLALTSVVAWHGVHRWLGGREALIDNVLILGTGHTAQQVGTEMSKRAPMGYRVVGFLGEHPDEVGRPVSPRVVGTTDQLLELVESLKATVVVVALDDRRGRLPVTDLLRCRLAGVKVEDAPSFFERLTGKILVADLRPSWLVFSPGFNKPRLLRNGKRVVEVVASALLLALTGPLLLLLMGLIRLESKGPALFRQERVGERGRIFAILKLRSMHVDAEQSGPVWASGGVDPRITRVGRVMRKLRLDELPQLVNVFRGDMSFVGPRPERPFFVEQLRRVIPYYDERHSVPPGITGWAQVKFGYGSTIEDSERKLQFDLYYVKNMSLMLDLAIVVETLKVIVLGRGAR